MQKRRNINADKRGSLDDLFVAFIAVAVFAVITLIVGTAVIHLNGEFQARSDIPTEAKTASTAIEGHVTHTLDNLFLMFFMGIFIIILVLAALTKIHPIFVPIYILGLMVATGVSAFVSNLWTQMASNPNLTATASEMTFMNLILGRLPIFVFVFGILTMVVLYKIGNWVSIK
jgi:hypothetical protein